MLFHSTVRKELARSFGASLVVLVTIIVTMTLIRTLSLASRGTVNPEEVLMVMGYTVLGYLPTVLTGVTAEMDVFAQELFGPVAVVYRAADEDEAVALANATPFGLGASVHSDDADRALRVADRLDAGMVSINEAGGSSADRPFGGVKRSGFGRELGSYGITEFVNHKLVRTAAAR